MTIGIDCRAITDSAGIGTYARQLVKNLLRIDGHNRYVLFLRSDQRLPFTLPSNAAIIYLPLARFKKFLPFIYSHLVVAFFMKRAKCDLMLFPANTAPLFYRGNFVVTIHDLAVYKFPELFPDHWFDFDRIIVVPQTLRRAKRIIAVSQNTKNDLIELFKINADKVKVVYEAGEDQTLPSSPFRKGREELEVGSPPLRKGEPACPVGRLEGFFDGVKYFLFLGTIEPRKNLVRLVRAYEKFRIDHDSGVELIIAGKSGWKNEAVFDQIKSTNQKLGQEAVKYLGFINTDKKIKLLKNCLAFVYPSIYEGFGLPVLEALVFGRPVITSANSSLQELFSGSALLINPLDEMEITQALAQVAEDAVLREQLSVNGQKKSQEFSWDKCAKETLGFLENIN